MNKDRQRSKGSSKGMDADSRAARQAAALRANLARRKAQARSRAGAAGDADDNGGNATAGSNKTTPMAGPRGDSED